MHGIDEDHLSKIMKEAQLIGGVEINVYYDGEMVYALEGVHRTEAAKRLNLPLTIKECEWDQVVFTDCEDVFNRDEKGFATVSDIHEYGYGQGYNGGIYSQSDFINVDLIKNGGCYERNSRAL